MTLQVTFELEEADLAHLRTLFKQARAKARQEEPARLLQDARRLLQSSLAKNPSPFLRQRLEGLSKLVTMAEDTAWQLPGPERERIMEALGYFVAPDDLIPDQIPVLGLLDDAIATEIVLRSLRHEIQAYDEFSAYREAESQRRANAGKPTDVSKEDWLADKRATLHSRMHDRRMSDPQGWHTITLFGDD